MAKVLRDYDADELATMDLPSLLALRREAYAAAVGAMPDNVRLRAWADRMTVVHGPRVGMHFHGKLLRMDGATYLAIADQPSSGLSWIEALMVARYGEDERLWPAAADDADLRRALDWERGNIPNGAFYLVAEG